MMVDAVIFDKDGTLIDFEPTFNPACVLTVTEMAGGDHELALRLAEVVRFDLENVQLLPDSELIAGTSHDVARSWGPLLKRSDFGRLAGELDAIFARACMDTLTEIPGVAEMLAGLEEMGIALGVATNDSESAARQQMQMLGMERHFGFIAGHDSGHGQKPGPGMIAAFADHAGARREQVMMVGDTMHDIVAGRAAGVVTVAVGTGLADHAQLAQSADYFIDSATMLPQLLRSCRG